MGGVRRGGVCGYAGRCARASVRPEGRAETGAHDSKAEHPAEHRRTARYKKERREKRAPHKISTSERAATLLERGERGKKRQKIFSTLDSKRARGSNQSESERAEKAAGQRKEKAPGKAE